MKIVPKYIQPAKIVFGHQISYFKNGNWKAEGIGKDIYNDRGNKMKLQTDYKSNSILNLI